MKTLALIQRIKHYLELYEHIENVSCHFSNFELDKIFQEVAYYTVILVHCANCIHIIVTALSALLKLL